MRTSLALLALAVAASPASAAVRRTEHPDGFALTLPPNWVIESSSGAVRASAPDQSEWVFIRPVLLARNESAAQATRRLAAEGALPGLGAPRLVATRTAGPDAESRFTAAGPRGPIRAHTLLAVRGGAGTLYLAAALESTFAARAAVLVAALQSFTLLPPSKPAPVTAHSRFTEPREAAYSLELPAGWHAALGVFREGALTPRLETTAASPDNAITLFLGTRDGGPFAGATPELAQYGLREGMFYNPTGIHPMRILRFLPGADFAAHWLRSRFPAARPLRGRARPDLGRQLAAAQYRYGNALNAQIHAGELEFETPGRTGVITAATEVWQVPGGGDYQWSVHFLAGSLAPPERAAEAATHLAHAVSSVQVNLQWLRTERAFARIDHARAIETLNSINQAFRNTMSERAQSAARNARAHGDLLAGTYRVLDPATNEFTTVQAGSNFYYRVKGTNTVYGVNQEEGRVDVTRMLRVDWDH
ncbi:MAG: hypothetical protein SFV54_00200 [Bryobacteraceae bacterium]|nr:hypothetical protein [Bryobacteraceae bacterium]